MIKRTAVRFGPLLALACIVMGLLLGCSVGDMTGEPFELRGTWLQTWSIEEPEGVDEMLDRVEAGGYNAVFANVLAYGHAYYESELLEKHPDVAPDFDPLAYLVEQAHQRGIQVHTWIVGGPLSYRGEPASTFREHPEWEMMGPDGRTRLWLNYTRPDAREFLGDAVLEIVNSYDVDGVHFDYTRYPGPEWGFDPYSAELLAEEYDLDLEALRYAALPAYATFQGNPLSGVETAQVLAEFDNGQPAVLLNDYGAGQAIVLNWDAEKRQVAVSSEILDRSIEYLRDEGGEVYVLASETHAAEYGSRDLEAGIAWLEDLGHQPVEVGDADLASLDTSGVLVLPEVFLINAQVAADLADFVRRGGGVIFIDGPTPSMKDANLQAVTGMRGRGFHFSGPRVLVATQEHEIIPQGAPLLEKREYRALDDQWKAFRMEGINRLLQEVYGRIKRTRPEVLVSITISGKQDTLAERHLLDWESWLDGGFVDLIIPRAYVEGDESLTDLLADWKKVLEDSDRVALGLKLFSEGTGEVIPKGPEQVLDEIDLARSVGAHSILLFDVDRSSAELLDALATAWPNH